MALVLCILGLLLFMYIVCTHIVCSNIIHDIYKEEFHCSNFLCFVPVVNMAIIVYLSDKDKVGKLEDKGKSFYLK